MRTLVDREDLVFSPPKLGCVLYLPGLPGGGSRIYDRSPYGNVGHISGATWVRLPGGLWCLSFDGSDDEVVVPHHSSLSFLSKSFTIQAWINTDATQDGAIVSKVATSKYDYDFTYEAINSRIKMERYAPPNNPEAWSQNGAIIANTWHFVEAVIKDDDTVQVFVDLVGGTAVTENIVDATNTTDLKIGNRSAVSVRRFKGLIALPRISYRALSAFERQNRFNREKHLFGVWQL